MLSTAEGLGMTWLPWVAAPPRYRSLPWFPLAHVGGADMARFAISAIRSKG